MESHNYYQDLYHKSNKHYSKKMKDADRYQYSDFHH